MRERVAVLVLTLTATAVVVGVALWFENALAAEWVWAAGTIVALFPALWWAVADLLKGRLGADVLAVMALGGTLLVNEYLAGAIVGVMLGTGQVLELYAQRRARRDLSGLLDRAPRRTRMRKDAELLVVSVSQVQPNDRIVVLPGEVVPVDGRLCSTGVFDESALTGEPLPVERSAGGLVRSGVVNAGGAVDIVATSSERDSTYAGVLRLADQAVAEGAPVVRLADRIAALFLPVAIAISGLAWLLSGDPVRAVAVLVTATPCPLLLAVPIAITAGMSRASRAGVVVRDGTALELLGRARIAVLDKTGTVTLGVPMISEVFIAPGQARDQVLRLAAAVESLSTHVLAGAVVRAAQAASLPILPAVEMQEQPGIGVTGVVDGHQVLVGKPPPSVSRLAAATSTEWTARAIRRARLDAGTLIWVTVDSRVAGALLARDEIRPDAARTLRRLRTAGLDRIVLLTGDRMDNAADIAAVLGIDDVQAECTPEDKVARVQAERARETTLVVGDGLNDAPALAAADVGIALGARGATAAAQLADAVVLNDRIDPLASAVETAARARRIAVQSAYTGIGLSLAAMFVAAAGFLPPVWGAVLQEGIDAAVILNSLRVLLPEATSRPSRETVDMLHRFSEEHRLLTPVRTAVRDAADALASGVTPTADAAVRRAYQLVQGQLLPHERAEEHELYPLVAKLLGNPDSTVTMSRGHAEIERLVRRLARYLSDTEAIEPGEVDDLRATLYGLDAVLTLHFAQEEQGYFALVTDRQQA